jgi:hypothetical protein
MIASMWRGHNIFYLATTLYIVVTDVVRDRLEAIRVTNVAIEPAAA